MRSAHSPGIHLTEFVIECFYFKLFLVLIVQEPATEVFTSFFSEDFDHLETLLQIHRPKKVLSTGSWCGHLVTSLNAPKDLHITPKVSCFSFHMLS